MHRQKSRHDKWHAGKNSWEAKMAEMREQAREVAEEAREAFNRNLQSVKHKFQ